MLRTTLFACTLALATSALADQLTIPGATYQQQTTINQSINAIGQVGSWLGLGSKAAGGDYLEAGRVIVMPDGVRAQVYGTDCRPGESKPCRSVKVSEQQTRVTVIPATGQPFQEYWTIQRLNDQRLAIRRQNGKMIVTQ